LSYRMPRPLRVRQVNWATRFLVGLLSVALLGGCARSGPPANTGDVAFVTCCVVVGMDPPTRSSHPSDGNIEVVNNGHSAAVLGRVRTGGGDGALSVRSAWVVPLLDGVDFGGGLHVPDDDGGTFDDPTRAEKWRQRVPLDGFRLEPGEAANILVVYDTTSVCGGRSDWLALAYNNTDGRMGAGSASTDVGAVMSWTSNSIRLDQKPAECPVVAG